MSWFQILSQPLAILVLQVSWLCSVASATQSLLTTAIKIRNATVNDAEQITCIIQEAFRGAPHVKYVNEFMDLHPRHLFNCLLGGVSTMLDNPDVMIQVALLPNNSAPHDLVPVGVAIWEFPEAWPRISPSWTSGLFLHSPDALEMDEDCLLIVNISRAIDFDHQFSAAQRDYLDKSYPKSQQYYLNTLGTHPDYQRRGAGGALVNSGIEVGKKSNRNENVTATLIATEAGEPLYLHLSWESIKNFTVKSMDVVAGVREQWRFDIMKHDI
ncbi:hypothetical protein LTR84_006017 [Exophiala bonariae]|uniref:N-acetyltransferase domain-containing protein n=1 Tax=Exophiala bonariae TaxID=1690606 RepID=A0AAV9N2L2_9EURO|nr:hypothetical protein LTR84_006017 [Exophiala bonariae]